jgi:hypothetical protein
VEVEVGKAAKEFALSRNYPNPFNPETTIEFSIPQDGWVVLKVFNVLGQEVATLVDREMAAGVLHRAVFDASDLPSGIYFSRLQAAGREQTRQMLLAK